MIYNVSRSGEKGSTGAQGVSVVNVIPEYRLSDSSSELTGSGAGYSWSETKPKVESGQYIWERQRNELSNNTVVYSDAVCDVTMSGVVFDVDQNKKAISSKVWQSDLTTAINQYDSTKAQSIRDRVTATEQDINGITSTVSDVQSTLSTKADGSALTTLQNTVSQNEQTASQFRQTVQSTYAKLTDVDSKISDIKISGHNLYIMKNDVPGYVNSSGGTIATQSSTYKERTSEYIPVKEGETYVVQSWVTPNTAGQSWLAYQFYTNNTGTPSGGRTAKYGGDSGSGVETTADGQEHLTYKFTIPSGVKFLRVSYRQFSDGYAMIEKANTASEYAMNPEDLEKYTDDAVSTAKSEIKQTTDSISLEVSKKVGASEIISKINQTPETITIDASKVNLVGQVTFSMLDNSTQNTLTSLQQNTETIVGTQTSNTYNWTGVSQYITSLYDGLTIQYMLNRSVGGSQVNGTYFRISDSANVNTTGAALNLTLANGQQTGNIPVWYQGVGRVTSHYGYGSSLRLVYHENLEVGGAYRATGWWVDAQYNSDTVDNRIVYFTGKTGEIGIWAGSLFMRDALGTYQNICTAADGTVTNASSGNGARTTDTTKKANPNGFQPGSPIWYTGTSYNANTNITGSNTVYSSSGNLFDSRYAFNTTLTANNLTPYKDLYLVGTVDPDDGLFYLDTVWWTQTPTDPTKVYVLVGGVYDSTTSYNRITLYENNRWIVYRDGKLTDYNKDLADIADEKAAVGLGLKVNHSDFSDTPNSGELYLHGYTNGVAADVDGYVYWNGIKRTVPKKMFNPNDVLPYLQTIYIVLRLSSANATTGTLYMVYYNSGWKYAVTPTPTAATTGNWTWTEDVDIVLGQFMEPSLEGQIVDAYLYDPPRNASHVITTGQNPYKYSQAAVSWVNTNGSSVVTAKDIINNWATDATNTMTTIDGGLIETHSILAKHLASDAIMSNNYIEGPTNSPYSSAGTFLDLSDGNIYMPNFGVNAITGAAYFNGTITAVDGMIGSDSTNYWQLGTITDYNGNDSAALVGHGTSYIQSGKWMISEDRIDTRWYDANRKYMYILNGTTYWDYGMQVPDPTSNLEYEKNFLYIRKHANTIPTLESDWDYPFRVTSDGKVYATDIIITGGGSGSTYLPLEGGTITGNLTVNGTLTATASQANKVTHSLSVNGKSFDGSATVTVGTLGVGYGGTGQTTFTSGAVLIGNGGSAIQTRAIRNNTSHGALGWTSSSTDNTIITTNTLAYWNGAYSGTTSNLEYVKLGKLGTVVTHDVDDFITTSGGVIDGSLSVTDLQAGNLVVTGAGRFTNGLYGDLTGNVTGIATYATKVKDIGSNADTTFAYSKAGLAANWTTTTWFAAWNGYELRAIGVANMKTTLGLNNVDNTADANKSVAYATSAGSATTATSATSATTATTATYSYYPKIVASNEIRFDVSTKPSTATNLHIGYKWSDGSSDAKITRYIFDNGNAAQAEVQASTFYGALSGNASTATTAGSLTTGRDFTIGKTKKTAVKWDSAVAFTQADISDCATDTADGWMSKEDKSKLDKITVSDIGRIGANSIQGATNGGVTVTIASGVATVKHTNQLSAGGTAQGTGNNTTLTNGGSFTVPTITYDINGHITATGTNKLTLPSITSVTGNAGTATKFASAQSVTLTGDTTGTASSQAGWSITTKTDRISTVADNRSVATTPNDYSNKIIFQGLKAKATIGNPSTDTYSYLVGLRGWSDSSGGNSHELAFNNSGIYRRTGATTDWGSWYLMLDTGNFNSYAPTLTGTGASGTWGISISGNATTATTASKLSGFTNTTSSATAIDDAITNGVYYVNGTSGIYNISDGAAFVQGYSTNWVAQIYQDYRTGQIAVRGKNNGTWQAWRKVLDSTSYSDYAVPKAGGAFTGAVTGTSFSASGYLAANSGNSGTAGGLALYSTDPTSYGIAMRLTSNGGKHGHVQGDWAIYNYMTGGTSRGFIWRYGNTTNVASIDGLGNVAFNGEVSIGTTGTTTDGSCSLVVDHDMDCLNFVWN